MSHSFLLLAFVLATSSSTTTDYIHPPIVKPEKALSGHTNSYLSLNIRAKSVLMLKNTQKPYDSYQQANKQKYLNARTTGVTLIEAVSDRPVFQIWHAYYLRRSRNPVVHDFKIT